MLTARIPLFVAPVAALTKSLDTIVETKLKTGAFL